MSYSDEQVDSIWKKGIVVEGYDPNIIRQDACGAWILRSSFGQADSEYCWEVDHICPKSFLLKMGIAENLIDDLKNLRPLNRKNNISKASDYPSYRAVVIADGEVNVDCEKYFTVNRAVQAEINSLYGFSE